MSHVIYLCEKSGSAKSYSRSDLEFLSRALLPDNIDARIPLVAESDGILFSVLNPVASVLVKSTSICLGSLFDTATHWYHPRTGFPDGSYAIFRGNEEFVELISDVVASRTVWYYMNKHAFIASTSQRAIVALLGSFDFCEPVVPWMLSTGTLGPSSGWDSRMRRLPGDASVLLDRRSWKLEIKSNKPAFVPDSSSDSEHLSRLTHALRETFTKFHPDRQKWVLPLSGGYDSRGILCLLEDRYPLRTVTWGTRESSSDDRSDVNVARSLSQSLGIDHTFYRTNTTGEAVERVIDRFLLAGEGRTDRISGYMDGFQIWKSLFEDGIQGIVRGDEAFGWRPVGSQSDVRRSVGLLLLSDFLEVRALPGLEFAEQQIPDKLLKEEGESLETWRDRLYQEFRIPVILAALNDLKAAYVEIANPLLSRRIIYQVRTHPDHLRTGKALFKRFVRSVSPDIPFARHASLEKLSAIVRNSDIADFLRQRLEGVGSVLPLAAVQAVTSRMNESSLAQGRVGLLGAIGSKLIRRYSRRINGNEPRLDYNVLAFRIYIITRMQEIFRQDAAKLARKDPGTNKRALFSGTSRPRET